MCFNGENLVDEDYAPELAAIKYLAVVDNIHFLIVI